MPVVKFFYFSRKTEDGGAEVDFYADKEAAQLGLRYRGKGRPRVFEQQAKSIELEFDAAGLLLTPDATIKELRQRLVETAMSQPQPEVKLPETVADQFSRVTRPVSQPAPAPSAANPASQITSLEGKVVAFAGQAASAARA